MLSERCDFLTAWYDGANIQYKESPNTMLFRQQSTRIETSHSTRLNVSPNPVTSLLKLDGIANASYRILDVSCRVLLEGTVPGNGQINTENLATGMYLLSVTGENGSLLATRFVKQ